MAILAVARDLQDLRRRLGAITAALLARRRCRSPPRTSARPGAMTVLLKQALKPNLIQTLEGQPCLMHAGPFANIAHGNSLARRRPDRTEARRVRRHRVRVRLGHGDGEVLRHRLPRRRAAPERGRARRDRARAQAPRRRADDDTYHGAAQNHSEPDQRRGDRGGRGQPQPPPRDRARVRPAVRRRGQPPSRRHATRSSSSSAQLRAGVRGVRGRGQRGIRTRRRRRERRSPRRSSTPASSRAGSTSCTTHDDSIGDKIEAVATRVYGAEDVFCIPRPSAADPRARSGRASASCRSAWPRRPCRCRPIRRCSARRRASRCQVRDLRAYTGAGWLVPLCGDIQQMPGLGRTPAALNIDIDAEGRTVGLF